MKIKMLESMKGSDRDKSGVALPVKNYIKGNVYDVGEKLANSFINLKIAKKTMGRSLEKKQIKDGPENKMIEEIGEDK